MLPPAGKVRHHGADKFPGARVRRRREPVPPRHVHLMARVRLRLCKSDDCPALAQTNFVLSESALMHRVRAMAAS
jgi:hypothetical protein